MSKGTAGTELSKRTNDGDERQQTHESQGIPQSVGRRVRPPGGGLRNRRYGRCVGRMRTETPRRYRSSPRRSSHRQDDLPDQSAHRRPGIAAGLRLHALADPAAQRRQRRRSGPGNGERAGRLCHRTRRKLFRHIAGLCAGTFGTIDRHCTEPSSPRQIFPGDETLEFFELHA